MACAGVPEIIPVAGSSAMPSGRSGETSQVASGTWFGGGIGLATSELLTRTSGEGCCVPRGFESGPARHVGGKDSRPSQIPSPSVSGLLGSIPRAASSRSVTPSLSSSSSWTRPPSESS